MELPAIPGLLLSSARTPATSPAFASATSASTSPTADSNDERPWPDPYHDRARGSPDLAVEVIEHFAVGLDASGLDRARQHARRLVGCSHREMAAAPQPRERCSILHHHRLELAVVQSRVRREPDPVAVLAAVGEGDQQRVGVELFAIKVNVVVRAPVAEGLAQADLDVRPHAAAADRAGIELLGDHRVETDPRDVEEEPARELAGIDRALPPAQRDVDRLDRVARNLELVRQAVPGSRGDDAEDDPGAGESGSDLIDGAVAAPRDHAAGTLLHRGPRELPCMESPLGDVDAPA